jgi:hypothetical protein
VLNLGEIIDATGLSLNLAENAVPGSLADVTSGSYPGFLAERKKLLAGAVRQYFEQL